MSRYLKVVLVLIATVAAPAGAAPPRWNAREQGGPCARLTEPPALPLHTDGRWILDANNQRFKLAAVNWYGAEEKDYVVAGLEIEDLQTIAYRIRCMGFNAVRLPWSNELYELDPVVSDNVVAANPALVGKHAMEVFDAVVDALAGQGLVIILDNHMSDADWCCSDRDGNGLWYNADYPEENWLADWQGIVQRYWVQPMVAAVDLRNEPRSGASWGGDPLRDWHAAAERGGNAVLAVNADLLVIVEGTNYALDLRGASTLPVELDVDGRLVYSSHDYAWDHSGLTSYDQLRGQLDDKWGYLLATVPVWMGEFGTCHRDVSCVDDPGPGSQGFWFTGLRTYLDDNDIDWCYWPVNGTQARGTGRTFGAEETYGIFNMTYDAPDLQELLDALQAIIPPWQRP